MSVKAKKYLGQHFLKDESIAKNIADTLTQDTYKNVLEKGPGGRRRRLSLRSNSRKGRRRAGITKFHH